MDREKILHQIQVNKLDNLDYQFLISQLCVLNNKSFEEVQKIVDQLIFEKQVTVENAPVKETPKPEQKKEKVDKYEYLKFAKKKSKKQYRETLVEDDIDRAYKMLERKKREKKHYRVDGKIQATSKGYAFLIPTDPKESDVYIAEKNLKGALNNDVVAVDVTYAKNGKPEGKVIQILERGNDNIVGRITISRTGAYVEPDDVKFGKDIYIPLSKTMGAENGHKVTVRIERYYSGKKCPEGIVLEDLGEPNKVETEVKAILRANKLYEDFPKRVKEYAENVPTEINKANYKNRLDLTDELIITIDGEDTRDIDDAISLKQTESGNWVLGVHIADVGEYVTKNNVLDKEAYKRGTSVYFPGLVLPMLPRELSNGICSLNEREDRLTLSVFIEYDKSFKRVGSEIKESIINSKKRFTYTEIQAIFDGDQDVIDRNHPFVEMVNNMHTLSKALMDHRRKCGYIEFDIPEVQINLDPLGDVLTVEKKESNDSHKLIEAFMVAANEVIAEFFCKQKVPFVYRIHETPDPEKINRFNEYAKSLGVDVKLTAENVQPLEIQNMLKKIADNDNKFVINKVCLRSMKKAKYTPDCLGHFGLALKYYCHFTSPIRRYPDLTIHRIIKDYINGRPVNTVELKQFVLSSSINSSEREVIAEKVEREVDDLYRVLYMRHHVGEDFEGIISGVTAFGIFVQLDNTVEGLVRIEDLPPDRYEYIENQYRLAGKNHTFKLGDKVKVKTLRADVLSRDIDFMLLNE